MANDDYSIELYKGAPNSLPVEYGRGLCLNNAGGAYKRSGRGEDEAVDLLSDLERQAGEGPKG